VGGNRFHQGRIVGNRFRHGRKFIAPGVVIGTSPYWYGYGYSAGCEWLRQRAIATGSAYWWGRYRDCLY
jgi:hypothetical protein